MLLNYYYSNFLASKGAACRDNLVAGECVDCLNIIWEMKKARGKYPREVRIDNDDCAFRYEMFDIHSLDLKLAFRSKGSGG